jgi:hypothetical protein
MKDKHQPTSKQTSGMLARSCIQDHGEPGRVSLCQRTVPLSEPLVPLNRALIPEYKDISRHIDLYCALCYDVYLAHQENRDAQKSSEKEDHS